MNLKIKYKIVLMLSVVIIRFGEVQGQCSAYTPTMNPDITADCPIKVVLVLDESRSINGTEAEGVRDGAMALANSLVGTGSEMAVVEFSSFGHNIVIDGSSNLQEVDAAFITSFDTYLNTTTSNAANDATGFDPGNSVAGYTNWEAGLLSASTFNGDADMLIFMTDGIPNSYLDNNLDFVQGSNGINFDQTALDEAIDVAETIKAAGVHMFVIGVTSAITTCSIEDISGSQTYPGTSIDAADYTLVTDFSDLADDFEEIALAICGTDLEIAKSISSASGCVGEELIFTINVTNTGMDNAAAEVVMTDVIPTGYTYVSHSTATGTVNVTGSNSENVEWTIGSIDTSTIVSITITVTVNPAGLYINTATVVGSNVDEITDSAPASFTLHPTPTASATGDVVCEEEQINLSASGAGGGGNYSWNGPNGFTSSSQNPIISNANTLMEGTYTVIVTNVEGCKDTTTTEVTVNILPTPNCQYRLSNPGSWSNLVNCEVTVCEGDYLQLRTTPNFDNESWAGPNSFTSGNRAITFNGITKNQEGVYTSTVTENGCSSTIDFTIIVNDVDGGNIGADEIICVDGIPNTLGE